MRLYGLSRTVGLTVLLYSYLQIVTCKPALSASQQVEKATKESDISKIRIEAFKRGILDQLGYSVPPNVSKVHHSIETKRQRIREFRDYLKSKNDMQHIPDSMAMRMDSRTIHQTYTGNTSLLPYSYILPLEPRTSAFSTLQPIPADSDCSSVP